MLQTLVHELVVSINGTVAIILRWRWLLACLSCLHCPLAPWDPIDSGGLGRRPWVALAMSNGSDKEQTRVQLGSSVLEDSPRHRIAIMAYVRGIFPFWHTISVRSFSRAAGSVGATYGILLSSELSWYPCTDCLAARYKGARLMTSTWQANYGVEPTIGTIEFLT